ncbi:MAG TPA: tetratricopeptide repeat protein [Alphaproteobacteria bacterium]|nr:tetratricopeptide repeat protein [Alphaproteobacteria bacterium]
MRLKNIAWLATLLALNNPVKTYAFYDVDWVKSLTPFFSQFMLCSAGPPPGKPIDWSKRETACEDLTKRTPPDQQWQRLLFTSFVLRDKGDIALSEKTFNEAVHQNKKEAAEAMAGIAGIVNDQDINTKLGNYPDAVAWRFITLALQTDPLCGRAHREKGNVLQRQKKHIEAVAAYSAAIGLSPEDVNAYRGRAMSLMVLGNQQAASADIAKAALLEKGSK